MDKPLYSAFLGKTCFYKLKLIMDKLIYKNF